MSSAKMIENPEVPGLELNILPILQPPPPPPPPPIISRSDETQEAAKISNTEAYMLPRAPAVVPMPIVPVINPANNHHPFPNMQGQFYPPPGIPPAPLGQAVPWWIPTEADHLEPYQWFDQSPKIIPVNIEINEKTKTKSVKRKCESIDPAKDAERVASAQRELSALMKPLKCDLCNAIMNSNLQAKLHYDGKPHQKKVSMFLNQSVKKIKTDDGQVSSTTSNDWNTYCEPCKTWFSSEADAAQHYAGKKHIRATTGVLKQKSPKKVSSQLPIDPTGRFGIGQSFLPETQLQPAIAEVPVVPVAPVVSVAPVVPQVSGFPSGPIYVAGVAVQEMAFRCELCGISANRLEQLETHKRGIKHQKMLKQSGIVKNETDFVENAPTMEIDYSIYRTPSGSYYCAPCNRSFVSENSFAQHVESRKHKNHLIPKVTTTKQTPVVPKKEKLKKTQKSS